MDLKFGEMVGRCSCNWAVWHHLRDMYLFPICVVLFGVGEAGTQEGEKS